MSALTEPRVANPAPATDEDVRNWLRQKKKFPHLWCPGCGLGIVLNSVIRSFHALGYRKDDLVLVSGIGCTGRIPVYVDCNTLHTTHGRALTFATGVKLAKPHLKVVVFMGDGDALAIGGNHFIHAARRNIELTAIVVNNYIYGMTGGQASPTTPHGDHSTTTPYGQFAQPFEPCELAKGAGATYVARSTTAHASHMQKMIQGGLEHHGFSLIEVVSNCPTCYGRLNKQGGAVEMLQGFRDKAVRYKPGMQWERLGATQNQHIIGLLHHDPGAPEFIDQKESVLGKRPPALPAPGQPLHGGRP
jgi:2-oxoglutarate ferredoxin oxidoreductase subunit beta